MLLHVLWSYSYVILLVLGFMQMQYSIQYHYYIALCVLAVAVGLWYTRDSNSNKYKLHLCTYCPLVGSFAAFTFVVFRKVASLYLPLIPMVMNYVFSSPWPNLFQSLTFRVLVFSTVCIFAISCYLLSILFLEALNLWLCMCFFGGLKRDMCFPGSTCYLYIREGF